MPLSLGGRRMGLPALLWLRVGMWTGRLFFMSVVIVLADDASNISQVLFLLRYKSFVLSLNYTNIKKQSWNIDNLLRYYWISKGIYY